MITYMTYHKEVNQFNEDNTIPVQLLIEEVQDFIRERQSDCKCCSVKDNGYYTW